MPDEAVTSDDIRQAAERLRGVARVTPLLEDELLNEAAGRQVLVKAECLQRSGSFKFRGAWSRLSAMSAEERARGVLAYSSGNHAQGVALAARLLGMRAVIVMPRDAPQAKIDGTRAFGARVVLYDRAGGESREALGETLAAQDGLILVRPYDEPLVIAGQGTCGLEIATQAAEAGVEAGEVLVCCGGGGLTAGVALALEAAAPGLRARPVEPEGHDDVRRSLIEGVRLENGSEAPTSVCDAIVTPAPGVLTFPIMRRLCGTGMAVSDDEAMRAMTWAARRLKLALEPGGAVALAAALFRSEALAPGPVVAVASGGNADPAMLARALGR